MILSLFCRWLLKLVLILFVCLVEASFGYVIISILMDGFEFNYILFLFQGLDFYLGMEG